MNNQGMNRYLKDSEILTILPAPADTRSETSIVWYEVQVYTEEQRTLVNACDIDGGNIATIEVKLLPTNNEVTIIIEEQNVMQLMGKLTFVRDDVGNTRVQFRSHDDDISIAGVNLDLSLVRASGQRQLVGSEQKLSKHWERMIDPLTILADALKVRAFDSNSWGCTSCSVLLVATSISAGACVDGGGAPACASALSMGATFIEQCEGACHHLIEVLPA